MIMTKIKKFKNGKKILQLRQSDLDNLKPGVDLYDLKGRKLKKLPKKMKPDEEGYLPIGRLTDY